MVLGSVVALASGQQAYSCSSLMLASSGSYTVDYAQLWQSSNCEHNFAQGLDVHQSSTLNLAQNFPNPVYSASIPGCFENGAKFNVWINNAAAVRAYMAPYDITIDPSAGWCNLNIGGTVDDVSFSMTDWSSYPSLDVNRICIEKPGAFIVSSYQFWAAEDCTYNFGSSNLNDQNDCVNMNQLPECFQSNTLFNLWVNAEAAIQAYMAPQTFVLNEKSQWATVTLAGAVDNIDYSIVFQDQFPIFYTSEVGVCNHGYFTVNNYQLQYNENCEYTFGTKSDEVSLSALASNNTSCFGPGSKFNVWVSPTAATVNSMAGYTFVYDPNAYPTVLIMTGTVDSVAWGFVQPTVIDVSANWICEPTNYPPSAVNSSNVDLDVANGVLSPPHWLTTPYYTPYPQCNNIQGLSWLTNISTSVISPNPTMCNDDLLLWLIFNLVGSAVNTNLSTQGGSEDGPDDDDETSSGGQEIELQPIGSPAPAPT